MIKVFRQLEQGENFVIGADPAESRDFCSAVAISKKHGDSAVVYNQRVESTQFGYDLQKLGKYIFNKTGIYPTIGVERQQGQATIAKLLELNYPKLFRMKVFDERVAREEEKIGWSTNVATRTKMLDDLSLALRQKVHKVYDEETISQFLTFIRSPKIGKPQSESGCFDDLVFAEAIAWQLFQLVSIEIEQSYYPPADDVSLRNWSLSDNPDYSRTKNIDAFRIGR